jgi:hypothetical protein
MQNAKFMTLFHLELWHVPACQDLQERETSFVSQLVSLIT